MIQILQQWLKKERKSKGISKLELFNSLNKPSSYVDDVERGIYALDIIEYLYYYQVNSYQFYRHLEVR